MKTALDKIGPLIVSLNVAGLNNYKPGDIINDPNCSPVVNHNALAVGYGTDTATGLDYYIVKNSWGSQWGKIIINFGYDFFFIILFYF
jgi:cathepsin C